MVAQFQRLHPDIIKEVKQRVDIVDVISEHIALRKCGKDYAGLCPFHDEKTPSFSVSPSKQVYHCFGCGAGGDAIKFLMELGKHSFSDVVLDLAQRYGVQASGEFTRSLSDPLPYPKHKLPSIELERSSQAKPEKDYTVDDAYVQRSHSRLLLHHGSVQRLALDWLEGRGITEEIVQHYRLGLEEVRAKNPELGSWESYWGIAIFIPVPGRTGRFYKKVRVAPWLTGDNRPKYLLRWSQPGVTTTVFTTYRPEDATSTYFCEGEWDAMALGWVARIARAKVTVACSTGGCGTLPLLEQLSPLPKPLIIFYDHDEPDPKTGSRAGEVGALRLADALGGSGFVGTVPMPHDCTVSGWDVSNALNAGYTWADFEASAARALKGCSAIVLYAESVKYNYGPSSEQWEEVRDQWSFWEWAKNEWQKREQGGGNGGGGKNYGDYRPSRKQVLNFCQEAFKDLYGDKPWIWVFNSLHSWNVNYYTSVNTAAEIARINAYCDSYEVVKRVKNPETGQSGEIVFYPYARPKFVREVWDWVTQKVSIDAARVNPPGLNCVDGVLQLSYDPDSQKWVRTLVPHDPQYYYLYPPQATYNIPAVVKPDACDTLLSCLDEPQCDIFLKTVAAALDLNTVRIYKGREIRAVLNLGLGSNGKDTLREVTAMMFGNRGMAGASLTDFKQYDEGRKFPLLQLDGALVNWPSENADCMLLDKLQSLKIAITGEDLSGEKKGKDEYKFKCKCVHFFNVNNTPKLLGAIEAITSRFAIFHYTKTYKTNPGPGELKADPRFLYDKNFVRTEVLPWYLHRVLDALDRLMSEGIDYSCTEAAFENVREESDHIYAFCKEVGIGYMPNAQITATVAWERLRQWYIANGTLEIKDLGDGKTKDIWNSQTTWGDHTVKGSNQILPRFLKLFPKATRERDSQGRNCLVGIGFLPPSNDSGGGGDSGGGYPSPNLPNSPSGSSVSQCNNSEAVLNVSENCLNQFNSNSSNGSEATEANPAISGVENLWSILTDDERTLLIQKLGLQKISGESTPNHFQQLQNPEQPSDTASSVAVQSPSGQVQSSHVPHTVQNLANQILLCQTWVQVASVVNRDGDKLKKAASAAMTKEQCQNLVELLATHLRENPADLNQLAWVPEKLRDRALLRLKFISCRIGGAAKDSSPITAGDKVEIVLAGSRYQGQTGEVRRVYQDQGLTVYTVQLTGGKRIDYQRSDLKLVT